MSQDIERLYRLQDLCLDADENDPEMTLTTNLQTRLRDLRSNLVKKFPNLMDAHIAHAVFGSTPLGDEKGGVEEVTEAVKEAVKKMVDDFETEFGVLLRNHL